MDPSFSGPLWGIRIVDCSTVLAGPLCAMVLGDLGADVVKVEAPDGDPTRAWGPPWVGGTGRERVATYFLSVNRNKRSLRLDLKQPAGREVLEGLLGSADVVIENNRVGGFARLGFDDDRLRAINPDLVHMAICGYGTTGPAADRPGYDFVIQAASGLMSITGQPDDAGGGPTKVGVAISDVVTGLFAAVGVLAGLLARGAAGGQRVDVSILESTLAALVNQAHNAFATGRAPERMGNAHPNLMPYETFATADGEIAVGVGSDAQWQRLCEALGLRDVAVDGRFSTNHQRVERREELRPVLAARFASAPSTQWLARLEAAAVPSGSINDVFQAFADPQATAREMLVYVDHPILGRLPQVGVPLKLERTPASVRTAPPLLGEHSEEILRELGYDAPRIAGLRSSGVI